MRVSPLPSNLTRHQESVVHHFARSPLPRAGTRQYCNNQVPESAAMPKKLRVTDSRAVVVVADKHAQSAVGGPARKATKEARSSEKGTGTFRFWHEERRFKGAGEACIVQKALFEAGGVRTGGYPKSAPIAGPLAHQRPADWDMLWSPARMALKALPVRPGQLISSCPGVMSLTRKSKLPMTLKEALGEAAFEIMPRSFQLPQEEQAWKRWMVAAGQMPAAGSSSAEGPSSSGGQQAGSSCSPPLWILKTSQHLGRGLKLLPAQQAVEEAVANRQRNSGEKPYVIAQQYVDDPLLIEGRKFGIRVWVLVTGHNPLRVYLHRNGLVLFSTHGYDARTWAGSRGQVALGHITNYAQNMDGMVWDLPRLQQHLGDEAFSRLWTRICRNTALTFSASLRHIRTAHEKLKVPPGATFELLGLDFLVDSSLHPWLLEVNGTPSLTVDHEDPQVEELIYRQKMGMVQDMVSLLGVSDRFTPRYEAMKLAAASGKVPAAVASPSNNAAAAYTESTTDDSSCDEGAGAPAAARELDAEAEEDEEGAAATAAASLKASASSQRAAVLKRKLLQQMCPTTDAAMMTRVADELKRRGAFEPLMPLFPLPPPPPVQQQVPAGAPVSLDAAAARIPWTPRDHQLRALLAKHLPGAAAAMAALSG